MAAPHSGDREAQCLIQGVHACLELCAQILTECGEEPAHGYRDALDKMVACGAIDRDLGSRLATVFDTAERLPTAWSTVNHDEFAWARETASQALIEFADVAERHLTASGARATSGASSPAP